MRILIFTDPHLGRRIRETASVDASTRCSFAVDAREAGDFIAAERFDLMVMDPELDFVEVTRLARTGAPTPVVYVVPADAILAEIVAGTEPFGMIARDFDEPQLLSLVSAARKRRRPKSQFKLWRAGPFEEVLAAVCALVAMFVGFRAPALVAAIGRLPEAYIGAGALSLLSLGLLLRNRRTTVALTQLCLVAVITVAPTQG